MTTSSLPQLPRHYGERQPPTALDSLDWATSWWQQACVRWPWNRWHLRLLSPHFIKPSLVTAALTFQAVAVSEAVTSGRAQSVLSADLRLDEEEDDADELTCAASGLPRDSSNQSRCRVSLWWKWALKWFWLRNIFQITSACATHYTSNPQIINQLKSWELLFKILMSSWCTNDNMQQSLTSNTSPLPSLYPRFAPGNTLETFTQDLCRASNVILRLPMDLWTTIEMPVLFISVQNMP